MIHNKYFKKPDIKYRPAIRWWLAEGFHTENTLIYDTASLYKFGFGSIEFLAMVEPGVNSVLYGWGSEEWIHDSETLIFETTKRKMGISMTCGTNWSNCNLISLSGPDDKAASKEIDFISEEIKAGEKREGPIPICDVKDETIHEQILIAAIAMRVPSEPYEDENGIMVRKIDYESVLNLSNMVNNHSLTWVAPNDGDYTIMYFYLHGTGQIARPSCSTSYTVNYLDRYGIDAFVKYWNQYVLTDNIRRKIVENGKVQMYMDSLELSTFGNMGWLWGYSFCNEFEKRRGYDIRIYLPLLIKKHWQPSEARVDDLCFDYTSGNRLFDSKLRRDFYQTMTELYMDNMLKPMQEWTHSVGMTLRAEISYGLPFEISQPGRYVDGIETESLEFGSQIESYRALAGPAHVFNRVYSSETGANKRNYMMGLDFYTQIIFTQFAADVSKTVLHGYSSIRGSEKVTFWPGHEGMWPVYSERFGERQPSSKHYKDWTDMISRYQMVLREGKPRRDVVILRSDYWFYNHFHHTRDEQNLYEHKYMRSGEGIYWKDMNLQFSGYTWDYLDPRILIDSNATSHNGELLPEGPGYRCIIIYQEYLDIKSAEKIYELALSGQPVLFVNNVTETLRPQCDYLHRKAASVTSSICESDTQLREIIQMIKSLPCVKEICEQKQTVEALTELGINPRVKFQSPEKAILTNLREHNGTYYFYAYHMLYTEKEPCDFQIKINGKFRPALLNCRTGKKLCVDTYYHEGKNTFVNLSLAPGESCIIELQKTNKTHTLSMNSPSVLVSEITLDSWSLKVEDWNEGKKKSITEDRGVGHTTTEIWYETEKNIINVGRTDLKPWNEIDKIGPDVSGIGYYETDVILPEDFDRTTEAVITIGSFHSASAALFVNDKKCPDLCIQSGKGVISGMLKSGNNHILIELATSLNNRLIQRDYYQHGIDLSKELCAASNNGFSPSRNAHCFQLDPKVCEYGITGKVTLQLFRKPTTK